MCRKREYLCYSAEITVPIGVLEVLLSNDSQARSSLQHQLFSQLGEPKKEELEVWSGSCGCPEGQE